MMRAMEPLVLYVDDHWISPYALSAFVVLEEKGLPFEARTVALPERAQERPDYRDRSLTGRVPALAHGDFWLAESSAIVEYLDEIAPSPPALPRETRARARARQVMAWLRSDLLALRDERPTTTIFYQRASAPLSAAGDAAAAKLTRVAEALVPPGATWLFGAWSAADTDLALMLHRLILNGHPVPDGVRRFAEANWQRPSVRKWVEHARPAYRDY
jgi:glutathione S-transferase